MALSARALFDFCARTRDSDSALGTGGMVDVAGTVSETALGHDGTPIVWLEAGTRGACRVECRCLSEEVLLKARPGSTVTLEGMCAGLEDSVTAVLERCELLTTGRSRRPAGRRRTDVASQGNPSEAPGRCCAFCGRPRRDVRRLVTLGGNSICDRCVGEYVLRLKGEGTLRKPPCRSAAAEQGGTAGGCDSPAKRFLGWLGACLSTSLPAAWRGKP